LRLAEQVTGDGSKGRMPVLKSKVGVARLSVVSNSSLIVIKLAAGLLTGSIKIGRASCRERV